MRDCKLVKRWRTGAGTLKGTFVCPLWPFCRAKRVTFSKFTGISIRASISSLETITAALESAENYEAGPSSNVHGGVDVKRFVDRKVAFAGFYGSQRRPK